MLHKICKFYPVLPFILSLIWESLRFLKVALNRALAPLRAVLTRELEVFEYRRYGTRHPHVFHIVDLLECGHRFVSPLWDFRDLVYAYVDSAEAPHVTAKRHRCHECRELAQQKKPAQSVSLAEVVGGAA